MYTCREKFSILFRHILPRYLCVPASENDNRRGKGAKRVRERLAVPRLPVAFNTARGRPLICEGRAPEMPPSSLVIENGARRPSTKKLSGLCYAYCHCYRRDFDMHSFSAVSERSGFYLLIECTDARAEWKM